MSRARNNHVRVERIDNSDKRLLSFIIQRVGDTLSPANEMCFFFRQRVVSHGHDSMHVQYSLSETTRIHDLSTRKMHLIRGNRRTAVRTNRTICTIRESLLRPVSIRVLRVIVAVCRLFLSTRKRHLNK